MKHCPECGSPLIEQETEGRRRPYCGRCKKVVYRQLKVGAGCIIEDGESILLVQRARSPFQDTWNLPAGYVEYDELPSEAAIRETLEETGLEVEISELAGVYFFADDPRGNGILIVYRCEVVGGKMRSTEEGKQIGYFRKETIPDTLAGGGHDQAIREWANRQMEKITRS